jgi:hypothetical protein
LRCKQEAAQLQQGRFDNGIFRVETGIDLELRPACSRLPLARSGRWIACPDLRIGDVLLNRDDGSRRQVVEIPPNGRGLPQSAPHPARGILAPKKACVHLTIVNC